MEKILIILAVVLAVCLVIYLFPYWKKYRAKKETEELIKACKNANIDKIIKLLEKGLNPNTEIKVRGWGGRCQYEERKTLLDISEQEAVRKLLRAYGAKNIGEVLEDEREIEDARREARIAENQRRFIIAEAEKKAKEEADMQKVKSFLASKKA